MTLPPVVEVPPVSCGRDEEIRRAIDSKTKPLGALGIIETLAMRIARIQGTLAPSLRLCRLVLFAADHGVAHEGVSAYPQHVTRQMVANFLSGGAAANVFAREVGVDLSVIDAGVAGPPLDTPGLVPRRIAGGTRNFVDGPAMSSEQCDDAFRDGLLLGEDLSADAAAFGEMGIANTSSASLVAHKLTGVGLDALVGRGTGLDDAGLAHKIEVLRRAAARTDPRLDPGDALREYGGFEIVMMSGAMIGAARTGAVVLVDGFIASVAALAASPARAGLERLPRVRTPFRRARPPRGARRPGCPAAPRSGHAPRRRHRGVARVASAPMLGRDALGDGELRKRGGERTGGMSGDSRARARRAASAGRSPEVRRLGCRGPRPASPADRRRSGERYPASPSATGTACDRESAKRGRSRSEKGDA